MFSFMDCHMIFIVFIYMYSILICYEECIQNIYVLPAEHTDMTDILLIYQDVDQGFNLQMGRRRAARFCKVWLSWCSGKSPAAHC